MIANVNPCDVVFEDSHNTLKVSHFPAQNFTQGKRGIVDVCMYSLSVITKPQYANRAKQIKIKPGTVQLQSQEVPSYEVSPNH